MNEHGSLPRARRDGLLEETVGDELLLYDQSSDIAHCLSPIAACVWRHCDGERDVAELALLAGTNESLVVDALHELLAKDLLDGEPGLAQGAVPGESRREVIVRVGRYGAAAAGASMIVSAAAATPAMASSGELPACCQCSDPGTSNKCACTTCVSPKKCEEFCETAPGNCKSGKSTEGFCTGTKCEKTGACV
jgi:hypothetical protein